MFPLVPGAHGFAIELISVPIFTGIIGYLTNWTGILMLFSPLKFTGIHVPGLRTLFPFLPNRVRVLPLIRHDGGLGWQGIIPSRADKMASISVDKGLAKLGSIADFYQELEPDAIAAHLTKIAQGEIRAVVEQIMARENPGLWSTLPPAVKEAVHARVRQQLPGIVHDITGQIGDNIDHLIDVKLMVVRYFGEHPELLNELFRNIGGKELRFMQNFGFYFGFPCGLVLVAILQVFPHWWVLPLGGVIIGWVVNYIGITMIFEPIFPTWYIPWRQGLLLKRTPEITRSYSKMVADKVITLHNIGAELLHGPSSDRTLQMFDEALQPAVDKALGPTWRFVRVAVGSTEYDKIRSAIATEATAFAPIAFEDADFNRRQAGKIEAFIAKQMRTMGPDDVADMLRSAIKQDEWLLFVHGGALGLLAGFLHLAIFPL